MNKLRQIFQIIANSGNIIRNRDNFILIYQMGKVGSTSILLGLRHEIPLGKIRHTHFLSDKWLKEILPGAKMKHREQIDYGIDLQHQLNTTRKRLKIITLVREPVSRWYSNFFENADAITGKPFKEITKDDLINYLEIGDISFPEKWIRTEFNPFLGIDLLKSPFRKKDGFTIIEYPNFDLLCIKTEKLNNCYKRAFKEFLGIDFKQLPSANRSTDKSSHLKSLHESGKSLVPSFIDLDKVYESAYCHHFYSTEELKGFRENWDQTT